MLSAILVTVVICLPEHLKVLNNHVLFFFSGVNARPWLCVIYQLPGFHILHINALSSLPKMDILRVWACSSSADITVVSESQLSNFIVIKDVAVGGFNVYHSAVREKAVVWGLM